MGQSLIVVNRCSLIFSPPADSEISAKPAKIRGTLTFFFNANFGSKPDVGSSVLLLPANTVINESDVFIPLPGSALIGDKSYTPLAQSMADGSGNFEISNVPAGDYTLVLKSSHAKGGYGANRVTHRDTDGRVVTLGIHVSAGQTIDASHDFGMSSF